MASPPDVLAAGFPLVRCAGDPTAFLHEVWGRRAEVFPGVDAAGYSDLLTFDDVDRILSTTSIRTPSFRLVRSDRTIAESEYTRTATTGSKPVSGIIDPARAFELFRRGATIVLQGLHRFWDPVTELNRGLEVELGHHCQVNAYVTPAGAQGLALHEDPHDVFVLQAFGRKHWEVHAAPGEAPRAPRHIVLAPGDCLYLPTGTPHAATTQDTLSGHLTVGVHVRVWRELVSAALDTAMRDRSLDEPVPAGWTRQQDVVAAELGRRVRVLAERLERVDPEAAVEAGLERFLSTRLPILRGALVDQLALDEIGDDSEVVRRRGSVCVLRPDGDRLSVLLGDRRLRMPGYLEPAMRRIAEAESLLVRDLASELPDEQSRLVLVRRLIREGLLRPAA
ncbi:MAG TPA: cupin domain-containing protein [Actinomycetota bacterium]|nr:cupin domain-containing protein [Actinomycetota bacterium]